MMFIDTVTKKDLSCKEAEALFQDQVQRCFRKLALWREILPLAPAIQDEVWDLFYESMQCFTAWKIRQKKNALPAMQDTETVLNDFLTVLYSPVQDDSITPDMMEKLYREEQLSRLSLITDQAVQASDRAEDRSSPLDSLRRFRNMMTNHLWISLHRRWLLRSCRADFAKQIQNELLKIGFEQSQYEPWDYQYQILEARYHQANSRIGRTSFVYSVNMKGKRSPWEIREILRCIMPRVSTQEITQIKYVTWEKTAALRHGISKDNGEHLNHKTGDPEFLKVPCPSRLTELLQTHRVKKH